MSKRDIAARRKRATRKNSDQAHSRDAHNSTLRSSGARAGAPQRVASQAKQSAPVDGVELVGTEMVPSPLTTRPTTRRVLPPSPGEITGEPAHVELGPLGALDQLGARLRIVTPQRERTLRDRFNEQWERFAPFHWSERDWRTVYWRRHWRALVTALALVTLAVVVCALTVAVSTRASNRVAGALPKPATTATPVSGLVVQQNQSSDAATPVAPDYQMGAWVGDDGGDGSVKVFVRVSHNTSPVPNASVTVSALSGSISTNYPSAKTDGYGLATFDVKGNFPPGRPVFVTATATADGHNLSAQTTFVPR